MSSTRRIQGEIAFPANASPGDAVLITIELRDVSLQDQASTVVVSHTLHHVRIAPAGRVPFGFDAPAVPGRPALALRVQVDMQGGAAHASGDFLSTETSPVPADGDARALVVPVTRL